MMLYKVEKLKSRHRAGPVLNSFPGLSPRRPSSPTLNPFLALFQNSYFLTPVLWLSDDPPVLVSGD